MDKLPETIKKENNRVFNLIWIPLFGIPIGLTIYNTMANSSTKLPTLIFSVVGIIVCLLLVVFKRNNFFTAFILLVFSAVSNLILIKFYDLTWLFSPSIKTGAVDEMLAERWLIICGWGIVFLIVMVFIYVFLSSWSRVIFKKTKSVICFFISLAITCIASYILFYLLPQTFVFPDTKIGVNIKSSINMKLIDGANNNTTNEISTVQSSAPFFVYAEGLPKGNRYGIKILDENGETVKGESKFTYCKDTECTFVFVQLNTISDRLDEGSYTIQIISQKGNELEVVSLKEIQITESVVQQYDINSEYPCEMWLTMGDSDEKLLRIDADSQGMIDITVMAQCSGEEVYEAQIAVGSSSNKVMYFQNTIHSTGEPMAILGLGGNTSHGYVRLIINNQIMGEAIIDRGFPICDDGKIVEGGEQINCE